MALCYHKKHNVSPIDVCEVFLKRFSCSLFLYIFFKWWQIVNWDVLRSLVSFWVLLCGMHPTNSLKESWSMSDEHPCLISSLIYTSREWNFENQFQTWQSVMSPWSWTLNIFLTFSVAFLLFLNCHFIYQIYLFISFILGVWNYRLNYDVHSFTTRIRMTDDEDTQ